MKILYVRKQIRGPFWKRWPKTLRDWYKFHHREGFFRASLHTVSTVDERSLNWIRKASQKTLKSYDVIIFNFRCAHREEGRSFESLHRNMKQLASKLREIPRILLITSAPAFHVPPDHVMDYFQLVFKREYYKDLEKYDISSKNRAKLRTTVLSCPLVPATLLNYKKIKPGDYGKSGVSDNFDHDVFFAGIETSKHRGDQIRSRVVQALKESSIGFYGGIQRKNKNDPVAKKLEFPRLSKKKYRQAICKSRINLALPGWGQFTYRHWEIWALSAFMMAAPSIEEIQLPFEVESGRHYETFVDIEELCSKTRYYLEHVSEREQIARQGRKLFEREYNFQKHGDYIMEEIQKMRK